MTGGQLKRTRANATRERQRRASHPAEPQDIRQLLAAQLCDAPSLRDRRQLLVAQLWDAPSLRDRRQPVAAQLWDASHSASTVLVSSTDNKVTFKQPYDFYSLVGRWN